MIFTEMLLQNSGFPTAYLTFYIPSAKSGRAACKKMSAMLLLFKETIFPIVEAENEAFTELSFEECNLLLKLHSKYTTALREKFSKL